LLCLHIGAYADEAADWAARAAIFAYDATQPLQAKEDPAKDDGQFTAQVVHFASANGETVPAMVCKPKAGAKPPVVLLLHGLGGDKSNVEMLARMLCLQGLAVVGIDAQYHGERQKPGVEILSPDLARTRQAFIQTVIDNRRAVDYIRSRGDLDGSRIGLLGLSMGSILGANVAALDPRIGSACLIVGGGRWDLIIGNSQLPAVQQLKDAGVTAEKVAAVLGDVDPVLFVGHISPRPLLMINSTKDEVIPRAATEALYEQAKAPKEIKWLEGGHIPPVMQLLPLLLGWAKGQVAGGPAVQ